MKRQVLRASGAVALAIALAASALPSEAGSAARSRPHSQGSTSSGRAAGRGSGRVATRAQGRATYGYGHGGFGYRPYSWDWYYGPWWSLGLWWGWPGYWGDGWGYGRPGWYAGGYPGYGDEIEIGPAIVETSVRPKKAQVVLDGEPIGEARDFNGTWDALELDPGHHVLEFEAKGCMTLEVGVDAKPGRHYRIAYALREGEGRDPRSYSIASPAPPRASAMPPEEAPPAPGTTRGDAETGVHRGFLKVLVSPPDAAVYLDGEFLGRGDELARLHGAIPVAAGEHRIEVVRPGYLSRTETANVAGDDQPAEVRIDLKREGGSTL
jgi:hypothetical protein